MKKCPFCAEEIQDDAIFCRYCRNDIKKDLPLNRIAGEFYCDGFIRADISERQTLGHLIFFQRAICFIPWERKPRPTKPYAVFIGPAITQLVGGLYEIGKARKALEDRVGTVLPPDFEILAKILVQTKDAFFISLFEIKEITLARKTTLLKASQIRFKNGRTQDFEILEQSHPNLINFCKINNIVLIKV